MAMEVLIERIGFVLGLLLLLLVMSGVRGFDYSDALHKSIVFYEGQRSGMLPSDQRVSWRSDSGLKDGLAQGVNLVGGYYDAGDNVKFGLPMAFTITMMAWSVVEYSDQLASSGELSYTLEAIKWGTDYLLKAHSEPNVLWGEVGDGFSDHSCWQRPEEMSTSRQAYRIDTNNPGSDLAGETAAALAASSIAFRSTDTAYSSLLLSHAKELFTFADTHRGKYDSSINVARSFYQSMSGYADELLWSAIWLYHATADESYLNYVISNAGTLGGTGWAMTEFSWDVKYAGVQVLASKVLLQGKGGGNTAVLQKYQSKAEYFLCACLQKNNGNVKRTPGGLMYWRAWNNMQYVTSASFLLTAYADYLTSAKQSLQCGGTSVAPSELLSLAQSQVDYILGNNPRGTSYMVGFGSNFPERVHHRGASIISYKVNPTFVSCQGGYSNWFSRSGSNPNILTGALVGGPDENDNYADERDNYEQSEPATYNNGPMIGVLARLNKGGGAKHNSPVNPPSNPVSAPPVLLKPPVSPPVTRTPPPKKSTPKGGSSGTIYITQHVTNSWVSRGHTYYRYEALLQNKSGKRLQSLMLSSKGLYGPLWGLSKSGNMLTLPSWPQSIPSGGSLMFVYIQAARQAQFTVSTASFV